MPSLDIAIIKLESRRGGDEAELTVRIVPVGDASGKADTRKLAVSSKMLFELGNIGVGSLPYPLTTEQLDTLLYQAELWETVKKGLDLLAYGDNTKSSMITKLKSRGYDKYTASDAADYLAQLGYIDERRMLARAVEQLANGKLYGPSRIKSELYKKGISRDILDDSLAELLEAVDFEENLIRLVEKKCDMTRLDDPKYRESVYAAFYRYGYSPSATRAAIKRIQEKNDE